MASEINDIYMEQGVDFDMSLTITDSTGLPFDLDLYTITFVVEMDTSTYNGSITEYVDGVATLSFSAVETNTIQHGVGRYDVDLQDDSTLEVIRLIKGRVYMDEGI